MIIVAGNFHCISQIIQVNNVSVCVVTVAARVDVIGTQTLTSWDAAARHVSVMILDGFRIDTETLNFIPVSPGASCSSGAMTPVTTSTMTTVMIPTRCHIT
jgi:hypothetical protein